MSSAAELRDAELRRFVEGSLEKVREALNPETLLFFGSRVEGEPTEWSDIDLLVVSRHFEGMRIRERKRLFRRIAKPQTHVDALCYTPDELRHMMTQPSLVRTIMRTGLRII